MKSLFITSSLAGIAALAATAALAQTYNSPAPTAQDAYTQEQRDYQASQETYRNRVENYQGRVEDYQARRGAYENQKAAADAQMDVYLRARDAYDARWGVGAYDRNRPAGYIARPPEFTAPAVASAYRDTCRERGNVNAASRGYIAAMAAGAAGANATARSPREGEVLGATVDASSENRLSRAVASCDSVGYFYSYDQTFPYRETAYDSTRRSGRFTKARYESMRCRLAIAPAQWRGTTDFRYIRVCPDRMGRYRITN
jgi:hypothetical protein